MCRVRSGHVLFCPCLLFRYLIQAFPPTPPPSVFFTCVVSLLLFHYHASLQYSAILKARIFITMSCTIYLLNILFRSENCKNKIGPLSSCFNQMQKTVRVQIELYHRLLPPWLPLSGHYSTWNVSSVVSRGDDQLGWFKCAVLCRKELRHGIIFFLQYIP